jgi:protocatechuate 3,4-dioxygenase beta subunit
VAVEPKEPTVLDHPHLITRRRSLVVLGSSVGGLFIGACGSSGGSAVAETADGDAYVATAAATCSLTAEQEEGPYYVDLLKVREDIIGAQAGLPFRMELRVVNSTTCKPVKNAAVDVWHCNAAGLYSDKSDQGTAGKTWLRGVQFTDSHGLAVFHSVYPGHYQGRTTHIHVKVHTGAHDHSGRMTGGHVAHTGNLFPTEAINNAVYARSPYSAETAAIVPQARDFVYTGQHGSTARMQVTKVGNRLSRGLVGRITLGVNPRATPALIGIHS